MLNNKASIIITTKNRPDCLEKCIKSVISQSYYPNEIIIVDDGELHLDYINKIRNIVENNNISFRYIKKNICGICKSRNLGAKNAKYEILLFVDDDSILDSEYIYNVLKIFWEDKHKKIGGVQGTLIEKRKNDRIADKIWFLFEKIFIIRSNKFGKIIVSSFESSPIFENNHNTNVEYLNGSCSYRKEVFNDFQFDELYEHIKGNSSREDSDFSFRVSSKYDLIFTPNAIITNSINNTSRLRIIDYSRLMINNSHRFYKNNIKNKTIINRLAFVWAMSGLVIIRVLFYIGHPKKERLDEIKGILLGYKDITNKYLNRDNMQK